MYYYLKAATDTRRINGEKAFKGGEDTVWVFIACLLRESYIQSVCAITSIAGRRR